MNTQSIDTRKVGEGQMERPGDFCFDDDFSHIYLWIPGRNAPDCIPINKGEPGGARIWGWDGNTEKPTLKPSIDDVNNWHGYLEEGKLKSC